MIVLAIDPGPVHSAYVKWDGSQILNFGLRLNAGLLRLVQESATDQTVDLLAIEKIASYGMTVGSEVFETCVWTGRFMQAWTAAGREEASVLRIPRLDIKLHHCHSSKANDSTVRQALIDRLGAPGTKKSPGKTYGISKDVWSALALAVCVGDSIQEQACKTTMTCEAAKSGSADTKHTEENAA